MSEFNKLKRLIELEEESEDGECSFEEVVELKKSKSISKPIETTVDESPPTIIETNEVEKEISEPQIVPAKPIVPRELLTLMRDFLPSSFVQVNHYYSIIILSTIQIYLK
jgi:hypothetical protein